MGVALQESRQAGDMVGQRLIRPEVLDARGVQWMGAIRMAQPVSNWLVVIVAMVIACALLVFVTVGGITRKTRVGGITVPAGGSLSILAANGGVLTHNFVQEGQRVAAGQALFELSTERQGGQGEVTALLAQQLAVRRQALEAERRARLMQDDERRRALEQRRVTVQAEATQLEQEIVLAQRRHAMAQSTTEKFEVLQKNGFMSAAQVQQKQEEVLDLAAHLSALERTKWQLLATAQAVEAERAALASGLASDLAQLERAMASLEQEVVENRDRKTSVIVAAEAGIVSAITYQPGQSLLAGQVLATLVPEAKGRAGELEVQLYAPSRTMGFVTVGQQVLIRLHAFPYEKFGLQEGIVTGISKTPFAPNELPANMASTILGTAPQASSEALYRVKVRLQRQTVFAHGHQQYLRPGMTLEADIVQDHLKIWEWMIEPLLAAGRRSAG